MYRKNKFFAKKVIEKKQDGSIVIHDSKNEYKRYNILLQKEKAGLIRDLITKPTFILQEGFKYKNERKYPNMKYTPDFQYFDVEKNITVIEEFKGAYLAKHQTDYKIRKRLLQFLLKDREDIIFIEISK
jgi:hypothetical protein